MKCNENESTPHETCIYRAMLTSPHKKYCPAVIGGLRGFSDGLVTSFFRETRMELY
jgi:hypothetical protein